MANTKIPAELSSTPGIIDNSNATAITIDSSENVGIGTTSPNSTAGFTTLTLNNATTGGIIDFENNTSLVGRIYNTSTNFHVYNQTANSLLFGTGGVEKMRIDSSGNLLVGTTDDVVWDNSANSAADNGHNLRDDGRSGFSSYQATANSNSTINVNRTGSDGDVIRAFKAGSLVGSIGVNTGDKIYLGTGASGVAFSTLGLLPFSPSANDWSNNALNLGAGGISWKDLYLSGGVYLGGTGSANKLDDYEEGTFGGTSGGWTVTGSYTKIGRLVHVRGNVNLSSATTNNFNGMPFAASTPETSANGANGGVLTRNTSSTYAVGATAHIYTTSSSLYVYSPSGSTYSNPSNGTFVFNFVYQTA